MQLDAVTVLGMGNMGCALIRALTKGGHRVTAWNRSDRSQQAAKLGIALAKNTITAIEASEVIIACLSSYEATHQVLESEEARRALEGKTLIQLSTGLPEEAMALAQWAAENRVPYLDGKIAVVPESIGLESAVIFWAGKKTVFRRHVATLRSLAGNPVYVGADVTAASKGDFAFLCYFFLSTIGILYGTAFWQASGLDQKQYLSLIPNFAADILGRLPSFRRALSSGDFTSEIQSTLKVDLNGAKLLAMSAQRLGLLWDPANFMVDCFRRGVDSGLAEKDTAALATVFRGS